MKIRILPITLAVAALLTLAACGESTPDAADTTAAPAASTTAAPAVQPALDKIYTFVVGETAIYPGAAPAILASLGEPTDKLEAPSCVHAGTDRVYYYAGFEVATVPTADGSEVISSITLTDDSVTTPEGVYIGMTRAEVNGLLGESSEAEAVYEKSDAGLTTKLHIVYAGDAVASIYYN